MIPLNALFGTIATLALCPSVYIKEADTTVDVVDDALLKLRGSVPVRNSTSYPAPLNTGLRRNGFRWIRKRSTLFRKSVDREALEHIP